MPEFHSFLRLSNISLYVYTTFGLSIHLSVDFQLLAVMNLHMSVQISVFVPAFIFSFFFFDIYLEVELLSHMVILLKFLKNFHTVFPHSFLMKVYITLILKPDTLQKRMNVHTVITDECWYKNTK